MSRILVGYDGSHGAKRALDRAVVEARDRHVRTAVVSVASMPLDLDAPRYYGTLDDISPRRGATPLAAARGRRALVEAREILAAAGVDPELGVVCVPTGDLAHATGDRRRSSAAWRRSGRLRPARAATRPA